MADAPRQQRQLLPADDPNGLAVISAERTLSWNELETRARKLANALAGRGMGPGTVWGVLSHNRAEWAEWHLANARLGSRMVTLNWHLTPGELAQLLDDSGAGLVVIEPGLTELASAAVNDADASTIETVVLGQQYEDLLAAASDEPPTERPTGSPMLFTGGTTGRSKGVVRSDQDAKASDWANLWSRWSSLVRLPPGGVVMVTTPLYHALGMAGLFAGLSSGQPVVLTPTFDPEQTLALIEQHQVTAAPMVPAQFIRMLKLPTETRERYDISSMQWILHTAAPCPQWAKRAMINWFGPVIFEMYGSSEGTGPAICDSEEWLARPGTVGKASARVTYSIVDEAGHDLGPGEVGTIYCRRDDGAPEYYNDPAKTSAMMLPDGRFTVGDLGWLDEDGYLFLADRRVDLILVGGSNVYPAEIEAVLSEHPDVADLAVFGIPDDDLGQQIKAVVEPNPGATVDLDDLAEFAAGRLARFKLPASYDIVDALPREAHGKLKKRILRDPYWQNVGTHERRMEG